VTEPFLPWWVVPSVAVVDPDLETISGRESISRRGQCCGSLQIWHVTPMTIK
jgi:hypothetical protein